MNKKSLALVILAVASAAGYAILRNISISAAPGGGSPVENTGPGTP